MTHKHIILFGGSFDPPHVAHVALPMAARQAVGADVVAYVPAAKAPHKLDKVQTDPKHRLAMLRLALGDVKHAMILTDEIDRAAGGEPSYTVDTLTALREKLGKDVKLRLLIGADQVRIFERFARAVPAAAFGGLGLGLYISRQIVLGHGGRIEATSEPGNGSTFCVELPTAALTAGSTERGRAPQARDAEGVA